MSDKGLRQRLASGTEDRLGRALSELLENPILTGALGAAFDARERAAQAQELAMGALNLPSAADIERLTRRLRSLSQRLEGIEDGVDRIGRSLAAPRVEARLQAVEDQLQALNHSVSALAAPQAASPSPARAKAARPAARKGGSPKKSSGVKRREG